MAGAGSDLFVGVTTWNSEWLLPASLDSLRRTVPEARIVVHDNESKDGTREIARHQGASVEIGRCSQSDALDSLARASDRPLTLLIHADVVLLAQDWLEICRSAMERDGSALVSPEDIGCGPFTRRSHGQGMPESSFLLFATSSFRHLRTRRWYRRLRVPYFRRRVDFYGDHVTYNLPSRLADAGLRWTPMEVLAAPTETTPIYTPPFSPPHWSEELGLLRYGLGNFYSLSGAITHYHNWYDRRGKDVDLESTETSEPGGMGVPLAYIRTYTERFLSDYRKGAVRTPSVSAAGIPGEILPAPAKEAGARRMTLF